MQFANRISEAIKQSNLSQKDIAKMLNISEGNITHWKQGKNFPSVDILFKLCIILDESADYLLGLEDETGTKTYSAKYNINSVNHSGNGDIKFS